MIAFLISQLIGLVIFTIVSLSLFLYLSYKRNKVLKSNGQSASPLWYRVSVFVLSLLFVSGLSYRVMVVSLGIKEMAAVSVSAPVRKEAGATSPETPL